MTSITCKTLNWVEVISFLLVGLLIVNLTYTLCTWSGLVLVVITVFSGWGDISTNVLYHHYIHLEHINGISHKDTPCFVVVVLLQSISSYHYLCDSETILNTVSVNSHESTWNWLHDHIKTSHNKAMWRFNRAQSINDWSGMLPIPYFASTSQHYIY